MATAIFGSIFTVTENRAPARRTALQNAAEQQAESARTTTVPPLAQSATS
jgi:hypothetical protein